jgi:methylmalonyl-CoA mutase cobalamin-binding subunit
VSLHALCQSGETAAPGRRPVLALLGGGGEIARLATAAIEGCDINPRLRQTLQAQGFDAHARFREHLRTALSQAGFDMQEIAVTRPAVRHLDGLPAEGVDAVLDVVVNE